MASMVPSTRSLLDAWGRQTAAITKSIEGTNNWTLLLSTDDGEMALRLYRTVDLERVQEEHRLLQALQLIQLPFRIPSPVNTTALETTAQLIWQDRPVIAALFPMLPGRPPADGNPVHAEACGRAIGQLHRGLAGLPESLNVQNACPPIDQIDPLVPDPIAAAAQCGISSTQSRLLVQLIQDVMADDDQLDHEGRQVIHGDLFASNMLVRDDEVSAVLDFECAGIGPTMMDVAVATLSLCFTPLDRGDGWDLGRQFANGYAEIRDVSKTAAETIPMLLRRREATSFVTRIARHERGEITTNELHRRADRFIKLDRWLEANAQRLTDSMWSNRLETLSDSARVARLEPRRGRMAGQLSQAQTVERSRKSSS